MRTRMFFLLVLLSISSRALAQGGHCHGMAPRPEPTYYAVESEGTGSAYYVVQWESTGPGYQVSGWFQGIRGGYQTNWGTVGRSHYRQWSGSGCGRDRDRGHGHGGYCRRADWRGHNRDRYSNHGNWH